jgi:hypothetical protein
MRLLSFVLGKCVNTKYSVWLKLAEFTISFIKLGTYYIRSLAHILSLLYINTALHYNAISIEFLKSLVVHVLYRYNTLQLQISVVQ